MQKILLAIFCFLLGALLSACSFSPKLGPVAGPALVGNDISFKPFGSDIESSRGTAKYCVAKQIPALSFFLNYPELQKLLQSAVVNNPDFRIAQLRVKQSRANQSGAFSALLPTFGLNLSKERGDNSQARDDIAELSPRLGSLIGESNDIQTRYRSQVGITGYEIDLWGRLQDLNKVARNEVLARKQYQKFFLAELKADVINSYFDLVFAAKKRKVFQVQLQLQKEIMQLMNISSSAGEFSLAETKKWQIQKSNLNSKLVSVDKHMHDLYGSLYGLTGDPELLQRQGLLLRDDFYNTNDLMLNGSLDSSVVLLRPDVKFAEFNIKKANGSIGAARAAFLPAFKLDIFAEKSGASWGEALAFAGKGWTVMPSLAFTIFDFGKKSASLKEAKISAKISLQEYQKTLVKAYQDLQFSVDMLGESKKELQDADERQAEMSELKTIARSAESLGRLSKLDTLEVEVAALDVEVERIEAQRSIMLSAVLLFRALGGGDYTGKCRNLEDSPMKLTQVGLPALK